MGSKDLGRLLRLNIPVDEQEQSRTCAFVAGIDAQITQTESLIAKQEQVRVGLMQDLFTRGVDETGRLRPPREDAPDLYHETALGWLPKGWGAVRVQKIAHVVRGSTPRPAKDPRYFDGTFVPWVTVGELSQDDWPYLETTSSNLTEIGARFSRLLPSDTLVISNSGYGCGVPKILKTSGCANDGIAALLELSKDVHQLFMYYWYYQSIETLRTRFARGNDQPNLNTDIIGNLWVPRPALSEQEAVADRIWCVQQVMEQQRRETAKLRHLRTALLRDLLTPRAAATAPPRIAAE
jgi:type I restriction enzyme S subunit